MTFRTPALAALFATALLSACIPQQQQGTVIGGATGALIGTAVADDDLTGALVGGAIGAAAGNYVGRNAANQCVYTRPDGSRFTAAC